jgi:hypothetical protein
MKSEQEHNGKVSQDQLQKDHFHSDHRSVSLSDVHRSVEIPKGTGFVKRMFAFAGPAYLVSVGYMDPGNWATDLEGGARFGYQLIWVLLMSNLMAVLLQTLSARMGIVTGRDLAQACRENYPKPVAYALWFLCEVAIAACDLAEVLGTAIGLNLLFKVPLLTASSSPDSTRSSFLSFNNSASERWKHLFSCWFRLSGSASASKSSFPSRIG